MTIFEPLYKYASPQQFYLTAGRVIPWLAVLTGILLLSGLYGGLVLAPTHYEQGEGYRIIYVHVPSAWMSMFVYMVMASASATALIWRVKVAEVVASASAPVGASFTFLALATGSLWGKPMWGAYWVWDARLTSELLLLFLYLGFMALEAAIDDKRQAARSCAVLALVGVVNIPIIHYSVEWWHTLHQGPTLSKFGERPMHPHMAIPLLTMAVAFTLYYGVVVLVRARNLIVERESGASWVRELGA